MGVSYVAERIQYPEQASLEIERLESCLASRGFFLHLYAFSDEQYDSPVNKVDLDEVSALLATTSSSRLLMLAGNLEDVPVRGWLSAKFWPVASEVQHLFTDDSPGPWVYKDLYGLSEKCSLQEAMLDVFYLVVLRAILEGHAAPTQALVTHSWNGPPRTTHMLDEPLMLANSVVV